MAPQLQTNFNPTNIFNLQKSQLMEMTEKMIETELGISELSLSLGSLGEELDQAHSNTQSFKKETLEKARKLAKKRKTTSLLEYKKSIDFI